MSESPTIFQRLKSALAVAVGTREHVGERTMRATLQTKSSHYFVHQYDDTSFFGAVAATQSFEYVTLGVIFLSAIWLGIETDLNNATNIYDSEIGFIIGEIFFCFYFTVEIVTRFLAFKRKVLCLRDAWFVFDSFLVMLMVVETWIVPVVQQKGTGSPLSNLVPLRLLRLMRLSRLIRLLRSFPELLTIVKGIIAAARSVASVLLFLIILDYVFAVVFTGSYQKVAGRKYTDLQVELEGFFGTVGMSMFTLFCNGTLLDDLAPLVSAIRKDSVILLMVFFVFIALSSFTVLNMLIGILCEVVENTGNEEKDKALRESLYDVLTRAFEKFDKDESLLISQAEFDDVCKDAAALKTLQDQLGIDPACLAAMKDLIFTQDHESRQLSFEEFLEVLIKLRPGEKACNREAMCFRRVICDQGFTMKKQREMLEIQVESCRALMSGEAVDDHVLTLLLNQDRGSAKNLSQELKGSSDRTEFKNHPAEQVVGSVAADVNDGIDCSTLSGGSPRERVVEMEMRSAPRKASSDEAIQAQLLAEATDAEIMDELKHRFQQINVRH
eukprot:TRINITY_DN27333_c0_g1_i1.p1 TRINITY_DN27333_c0_g1~~TRINITY_DN27333_c0_g1_i1.p1  ORF type:complete len:555 (+),score=85.18 TRINITY_DN27333_c0_g1_i1:139-1803(+)